MLIDAIVLAGGRSSRLGSVPKAGLRFGHQSLLALAVEAVRDARHIVVVGEADAATLPDSVAVTRENPPFGGPAAGIAAGVALLEATHSEQSDFTVVLACDMPHSERAVAALLEGLHELHEAPGVHEPHTMPNCDGVIAVDGERRQPLAAAYRTNRLASAVDRHRKDGRLHGLPVFSLIAGLTLAPIEVPAGSTDDVDTWSDAARFDISPPERIETP